MWGGEGGARAQGRCEAASRSIATLPFYGDAQEQIKRRRSVVRLTKRPGNGAEHYANESGDPAFSSLLQSELKGGGTQIHTQTHTACGKSENIEHVPVFSIPRCEAVQVECERRCPLSLCLEAACHLDSLVIKI